MTTPDELKSQISLSEVIEADLGPGKRVGQWRRWLCPFHADKSPSLAVGPDDRVFKCFGCGASGDVFTWLERRRGLSFPEARDYAANLAGMPTEKAQSRANRRADGLGGPLERPGDSREPDPPSDQWQEASWEIVARCQAQLWDTPDGQAVGLAYLYGRGLVDDTIAKAGLGWCPGAAVKSELWGLERDSRVVLHRGVVIPLIRGQHLWGVKTRVFGATAPESGGGLKYRHMPGGGDAWPYGLDLCRGTSALLVLEGEFDQMLARQEIGLSVDAIATKSVKPYILPLLLSYDLVMAAYDRDAAGDQFGQALQRSLPRVCLLAVPVEEAKADVTAFYQQGGDLRLWLSVHQSRCQRLVS